MIASVPPILDGSQTRDGRYEYSVRRITKFGEPVIIPAAGIPVKLPTDTF